MIIMSTMNGITSEQFSFYQLVLRKHACRLRYILHQLNSGLLDVEELKRNIEYAALVLETAYMDETRRVCDEDDDLAEVTVEAVPEEVRDWLAATFTRQAASGRPAPKFKSVATAIKMGIKFDRMFRKSTVALAPIPQNLTEILSHISEWGFSPFELNETSDGHALKYTGYQLFNKFGFLDQYRIPWQTLENYLMALEVGYSKHNNPYHNLVHAADVAQTSAWMLTETGFSNCLSDLECFAVVFSALIHDYEHTGHTNNFHIQSNSDFAYLYNDRSVLENHHVSSCFRLTKDGDKNVLSSLSREQYREFRNICIEIVLATDMSTHFVQIKTMKNMLTLPEGIDKIKAMCLIVHACDISHAAKPFHLHERWTMQVLAEFFRQGDLEQSMGLPFSPLCDRNSVHVPESQIGFIDFIVEPTMVVCGEMLTKMVEPLVSIPSDVTVTGSKQHESSGNLLSANAASDGDSVSNSGALSPSPFDASRSITPGAKTRRLPLSNSGRLEIPMPWAKCLHDNKVTWKGKAHKESERKKKAAAEEAAKAKPAVNGEASTKEKAKAK